MGMHFGFPLPITRADADYYPLMVANSFLGEHRTFHGRLMQQLRGVRGLNYGDYSYIEYWDNPPGTSDPPPGVAAPAAVLLGLDPAGGARRRPFRVARRPLRSGAAARPGADRGRVRARRDFLINYSKLWAQSLADRLGFHMDSRFYGTPYFIDEVEKRLQKMTVADVNAAVKKYLSLDNYEAVLVTDNAAQVKETLQKDAPSPKTYNSPVPPDVAEADKTIQALQVKPTSIEIVPVAKLYEK